MEVAGVSNTEPKAVAAVNIVPVEHAGVPEGEGAPDMEGDIVLELDGKSVRELEVEHETELEGGLVRGIEVEPGDAGDSWDRRAGPDVDLDAGHAEGRQPPKE